MYVTAQERQRERERRQLMERKWNFPAVCWKRRNAETATSPDVTAEHAAGAELLSNTDPLPPERAHIHLRPLTHIHTNLKSTCVSAQSPLTITGLILCTRGTV